MKHKWILGLIVVGGLLAVLGIGLVAAQGTLDYRLRPTEGTVELRAGFRSDPYDIEDVQAGARRGAVNVSRLDLGRECTGYAAPAPTLRLIWSGSSRRLRIFFVPDRRTDDTTMIINNPRADWYCNDDSDDGLNPTVTFQNPSRGQYDIWIGTYRSGTVVEGTLYITELNYWPSDYD